jgi:hypothetical protein
MFAMCFSRPHPSKSILLGTMLWLAVASAVHAGTGVAPTGPLSLSSPGAEQLSDTHRSARPAIGDLWEFVRAMLKGPVDEKVLESSFNVQFYNMVDSSTDLRFEGTGPLLADGTRIANVLLIKYRTRPDDLIVNPYITGRCVNIAEIEAAFLKVDMIAAYLHGDPEDTLVWGTNDPGGRVEFFLSAHSRCLTSMKIFIDRTPKQAATGSVLE